MNTGQLRYLPIGTANMNTGQLRYLPIGTAKVPGV